MTDSNDSYAIVAGRTLVGAAVDVELAVIAKDAAEFLGPLAEAAVPAVVTRGLKAAQDIRRMRVEKWWKKVAEHSETEEEFAARVETKQDEPFVRETIFESVRSLYEAIDDIVVLPIAVLTREYLSEGKEPDSYFRAVVAMLRSVSRSDFLEFLKILDWALEVSEAQRISFYPSTLLEDQKTHGDELRMHVCESFLSVKDAERFGIVMRRHGLGEESSGLNFGAGPGTVHMERAVAERLLRLMRLASS